MKRNLLFLVVLSGSILLTACDDDDFSYFGGNNSAQFGNMFFGPSNLSCDNITSACSADVTPQVHDDNWIGIIAEDGQAHFFDWQNWGDGNINHIVGEAVACEGGLELQAAGYLNGDSCDFFNENLTNKSVNASIIDFDEGMYYKGYVAAYEDMGNFEYLGHFELYPAPNAMSLDTNSFFGFSLYDHNGFYTGHGPNELETSDLYKQPTKLEDLAGRQLSGHSGDNHFGLYRLMTANEVIDGRLRFDTWDDDFECGGGSGYFYYIDTRFNPVGVYMDYNGCSESVNGDYKGVAFVYPPDSETEECITPFSLNDIYHCEDEQVYWSLKGDTEDGETRAWFAGFGDFDPHPG
jgi:hypothetical protein